MPAENTPDNRVSAGERYARIYEINMSRCIFCGYCELACPFDAIVLGNDFEISEYNRDDLIYTKDILLAPPIKQVPVADPRSLRHADPLLQGPLVVANFLVWVVWLGAAFGCLASALAVVSFRNPFYSALALIGNLASLAVLFLLLSGEFVAAGQVLVYGGAVMVMFLFVIAYLGDRSEDSPWSGGPSWQIVGAVLAGGAILAEVIVVVGLKAGASSRRRSHITRSLRLACGARPAVPHRPPARLRGDVDRAARRCGRRRRPRLARAPGRGSDGGRCAGLTSSGT